MMESPIFTEVQIQNLSVKLIPLLDLSPPPPPPPLTASAPWIPVLETVWEDPSLSKTFYIIFCFTSDRKILNKCVNNIQRVTVHRRRMARLCFLPPEHDNKSCKKNYKKTVTVTMATWTCSWVQSNEGQESATSYLRPLSYAGKGWKAHLGLGDLLPQVPKCLIQWVIQFDR